MFYDLFNSVDYIYIFIFALLFFAGVYSAPFIVEKNIRWMLAYPRWMGKIIEKYFNGKWPLLSLFFLILFLNNLSLFSAFVSGYLLILPPFYAFFTGFNITVISYDLMGWRGVWHLLVNPVAWLEFPAVWLSLAFGGKLAGAYFANPMGSVHQEFIHLLPLYIKYIFSLLVLAAILESVLIKFAENLNE